MSPCTCPACVAERDVLTLSLRDSLSFVTDLLYPPAPTDRVNAAVADQHLVTERFPEVWYYLTPAQRRADTEAGYIFGQRCA